MSEIDKIKLQLNKAWDLIDKLEEDNLALSTSVRNLYFQIGKLNSDVSEANKKIQKLGMDNKFLRQIIKVQTPIDPAQIGNFLKEQYKSIIDSQN